MNINDIRGALPHGKKNTVQKPGKSLATVWGEGLDPDNVLQEYPRPALVRGNYTVLNGYWKYAVTRGGEKPQSFDGMILVPFSPECSLSGVNRQIRPNEYLWYEREVDLPGGKAFSGGGRILLHFEAVDQCAIVYIDGRKAARHVGGYLPFTVDITDFLKSNAESFTLTVRVQDYSDTSYHSRGKQKLEPSGMYYSAQSGIWQNVWMETVPCTYIENVLFETEELSGRVRVTVTQNRAAGGTGDGMLVMRVYEPDEEYYGEMPLTGSPILEWESPIPYFTVSIPEPRLWSCEHPWLYPVDIELGEDRVRSYLAIRLFSKKPDDGGKMRLCLNGVPVFLNGVLDQGYWPDGLYTAPSDEALVYDITKMKELGFNMLRKHAKIECRRWYYHCDRLGMIVWQDMVNGGGDYSAMLLTYIPTGICVPGPLMKREKGEREKKLAETSAAARLERKVTGRMTAAGRREFRRECTDTVALLKFHPSIMAWVIFNEGWGQFETEDLTKLLRTLDPKRLIDSASGWFEHKTGDIKSVHNYFRKMKVPADIRAVVISEYGGYVYHIDDHSMYESTYGYHTCSSACEFRESFARLMNEEIKPLESKGLCGAVYTQVSDIEEETNGILTYDRKVCKLQPEG